MVVGMRRRALCTLPIIVVSLPSTRHFIHPTTLLVPSLSLAVRSLHCRRIPSPAIGSSIAFPPTVNSSSTAAFPPIAPPGLANERPSFHSDDDNVLYTAQPATVHYFWFFYFFLDESYTIIVFYFTILFGFLCFNSNVLFS